MKTKNMTTLHLGNSISRSPVLRRGLLLTALAFFCFAPATAPTAFAVSPPPDGGYSGGNTAEGTNALFSLTSGVWNTAIGSQSLYHVTTGTQNTATGYQTLFSNTGGSKSTAYGSQSLYNNTTGSYNTATGFRTLYANTEGSQNTGIGYEALALNTTGHDNRANGDAALYRNTNGSFITANGASALYYNTSGNFNTAVGTQALFANTTDSNNTAIGSFALGGLYSGDNNTATGVSALNIQVGSNNTADGSYALGGGGRYSGVGDANTAIGAGALGQVGQGLSSTSGNTALGSGAGGNLASGDNNIYIGNPGVDTESGTVRIGTAGTQTQTFIAGIFNVNESGTILPVYINSDGQLGTQPPASSRRFKKAIKRMDNVSEAILALKPVTFHYKSDPAGAGPQFGLIAEEVAEINPDLVVRDEKGEIYTVRYDAVNAMLLNEFLKEHRKVEELTTAQEKQRAMIAQQQKEFRVTTAEQRKDFESKIAHQQTQIEALTAGLQRVSAQVEIRRPAPQTALNSP
jgi:hypothetical protein